MDDSTLAAAYIAAAVALGVFLLERVASTIAARRSREREGVEIVYTAIAEVLSEMFRDRDVFPYDAHTRLVMAGARMQLRLPRSQQRVGNAILVAVDLADRAGKNESWTTDQKIKWVAGLFAVLGNALVDWHRLRLRARSIERRVTTYAVTLPDAPDD